MKETMELKAELISFACKEAGCAGVVTDKPEFTTSLRIGCSSFVPAVFCPVCGRLYWPDNTLPCRNRQRDNAFIKDGNLENRPMPATEKKDLVRDYMDLILPGSQETEIVYVRNELTYLVQKGHAPDCPAKDSEGECICGNTDAERWITDHPGKEVAITE